MRSGSDLIGLVDHDQALQANDPTEFSTDGTGTPTGPNAKKLAAAIDEVGDLGPLMQEAQHAGALEAKAERDRKAFVAENVTDLLAAMRPQAEAQPVAIAAAVEGLREALSTYIGFNGQVAELLAAANLDTRVPGLEEAANLRRSLEDIALPVPITEVD